MNVPRHHHYVPQFHLRRFGHGAGHGLLWAYDKTLDKIVRAKVKGSAQEIDYNAVADATGGLNYEIEGMFARLEGEAKPIIDRLLALPAGVHRLDRHDRAELSLYIALQHARAPATRAHADALAALAGAASLDMRMSDVKDFRAWARQAGWSKSGAEIERRRQELLGSLRSGAIGVRPPTGYGLITNLSASLDALAPRLFAMSWHLVRRRRFPWLVVGDNPVTKMALTSLPASASRGFATPGIEVMIPFSPTELLDLHGVPGDEFLRVHEPDEDRRPSLMHEWNAAANATAWTNAHRRVYARSHADLEAVRLSLGNDHVKWPHPDHQNWPHPGPIWMTL
ncbi:MAG: DUF4238 domain-containing protein [Candidatus Limnocylindrales bacterium]